MLIRLVAFCTVSVWLLKERERFQLKALRTEYERLIVQHNQNKMEINIKLNELQKIKDELDSRNAQAEEDLVKNGEKYRTDVSSVLLHTQTV
jgi:hypothetical protein